MSVGVKGPTVVSGQERRGATWASSNGGSWDGSCRVVVVVSRFVIADLRVHGRSSEHLSINRRYGTLELADGAVVRGAALAVAGLGCKATGSAARDADVAVSSGHVAVSTLDAEACTAEGFLVLLVGELSERVVVDQVLIPSIIATRYWNSSSAAIWLGPGDEPPNRTPCQPGRAGHVDQVPAEVEGAGHLLDCLGHNAACVRARPLRLGGVICG